MMQMTPSGIVCHLLCKTRDSFKTIFLTSLVPLQSFLLSASLVINIPFEDFGRHLIGVPTLMAGK